MAALAGARRTDSAYGRYLQAAKASDVMIAIPGPLLSVVREVEGLHGRLSAAAWLGLNAEPVIDGKLDPSFQTDAIAASLGGEYFRQDKMTVLAGKLPALDSTDEIAVTEPMAKAFGLPERACLPSRAVRLELGNADPVAGRLGILVTRLHDLDHGASARHHRMV